MPHQAEEQVKICVPGMGACTAWTGVHSRSLCSTAAVTLQHISCIPRADAGIKGRPQSDMRHRPANATIVTPCT